MNAMNKLISKKLFIINKILTPKFLVIIKKNMKKQIKKSLKNKKLKFPLVIKPNNEGSSIGVRISRSFISLQKIYNFF